MQESPLPETLLTAHYPAEHSSGPEDTDGPQVRPAPDTLPPPTSDAPATVWPGTRVEEGPAVPAPTVLQTIAGYEVLGELGRGGMGVVYKARQKGLKRLVALKMVLAARAGAAEVARFRAEAEAVARLRHPNIVQIYEVGEHDGQPFFSLEYVAGGSLDRALAGKPLPPEQAARLLLALATAMQAAHEQGIVHRDLKPANVLLQRSEVRGQKLDGGESRDGLAMGGGPSDLRPLTSDLWPKITDFGLAKQLDEETGQTRSGTIMGTPSYMAPEQAEGRIKDIGPWTDVYALGSILYETLTGRPPFVAESVWDTLEQVRTREPVSPRQLNARVPADLETVCLKCLRKGTGERYASAGELAEDLRRFLDGEPIKARPVGPVVRALKWARRRRAVAALLAVSVLATVAGSAAVPWHIVTLHTEADRARNDATRESNGRRRADARASAQAGLLQGQDALARGTANDLRDARGLFAKARDLIAPRDATEDPALDQLRHDAERRLEETEQRLSRLAAVEEARARARKFFALRDEAFFQFNRDVFTGADEAGHRAGREAAEQALALFGVAPESPNLPALDGYDPARRDELNAGLCEVLLMLAEATARRQPGQTPQDQRRHTERALRILDQAARQAPALQAIHRRRARYLAQLGDAAGADRERNLAGARAPGTPLDWFLAGCDRWFEARDVAGAVHDFKQALGRQPNLFWAQFFNAVGCRVLKDRAEARASLTVCARERPDFVWTYLLRGFLNGEMGDPGAAEEDFARAAGLEKAHPDEFVRYVLHLYRGLVAYGARRYDAAVADFQQAVRIKPALYNGHVNLAQAHLARGDLDAAARHLDEAIHLRPGLADLHRSRARLLLRRQDADAALRDLDEAVRLERDRRSPNLAKDHLERALILVKAGKHSEAVAACDAALAIRPDYPAVHLVRAEALFSLKRYREAGAALDRYLEKGPPRAEVFRKRALVRTELGDVQGILDDYARALALGPDAEVHALRGWAYLVNRAPALALRDFEAALRLDPAYADAYAGRGYARVQLGKPEPAVADAEEALRRGPLTARLLYKAARVFAQASAAPAPPGRGRYAADWSVYCQARAVGLLREALARTPEPERAAFWRDRVARDAAFAPVRSSLPFARLETPYRRAVY